MKGAQSHTMSALSSNLTVLHPLLLLPPLPTHLLPLLTHLLQLFLFLHLAPSAPFTPQSWTTTCVTMSRPMVTVPMSLTQRLQSQRLTTRLWPVLTLSSGLPHAKRK